MTKIKICGLTKIEDIQAANRYQPDYIGFVFAEKSRRYIAPEQAASFRRQLSDKILAVGVFVNAPKEYVAELLEKNTIDIAQLHGQETESEIRWIKNRTGRQIIKAVSVQSRADIDSTADSPADYLLFDHGTGGTGQAFDWTLLSGCTKPYFLAGGIYAGNLLQALARKPYAVDVSSGVETNGQKDPVKMEEIINAVRMFRNSSVGCLNCQEL